MSETTTTSTATTPAQITLNDLNLVIKMIDICSKRGAFEGPELAGVGALRNRFADVLKANTVTQETSAPVAMD